jgi:hypothetical protein
MHRNPSPGTHAPAAGGRRHARAEERPAVVARGATIEGVCFLTVPPMILLRG